MKRGQLYKVLAVNLLIGSAVHAVRPLVSYRALDLGAGPIELGIIAASFALVSLLIAVFVGRWVDRWGESLFMISGSIGVSLVALLLTMSDSVLTLAIAMAALGLSQILTAVSIQTLIASAGELAHRDARFGWQSLIASLGQFIGPIAAGFLAGIPAGGGELPPLAGIRLVFVVASLASAGAAVFAIWLAVRWRSTRLHKSARRNPTDTTASAIGRVLGLPNMPQAMFASLAVLASVDILIVYLPAFAIAAGIDIEVVGLLLATRAAAAMLSRALIFPLRTVFRRSHLLAIAMLTPAVALTIFPLIAESQPAMFVLMAITGFGLGLGQPLTVSWVAARAPVDLRGTAIGVRLSGNRLGQLVVPAAVGVAASAAGLSAVFWSVSVMLSAGGILVMRARFEEPEQLNALEPGQ